MNTDAETLTRPGTDTSFGPAVFCLLAACITLALFWPTIWSMVEIWERSETFAHGYLILPISLWLIWRRRDTLALVTPRPDWRGLALLIMLGFGWLLARVAEVQVVQQLAVVGMLPSLVLTCLGWSVVRVILFPLLFLFFAVPMGEALIPPMMDFTAVFVVQALRWTGLPVYAEGTYFSIPSGSWSVVEGCSGVRYLIASITMGTLYAYLTYQSYWRRSLFILLSAVTPVIANGLRAYMIVMIAHLSDMKLAMGVDHFIYGWVFFGLVMLLLFWIGSWWREPEQDAKEAAGPLADIASRPPMARFALVAGVSLVMLSVWPAWSQHLHQQREHWVAGELEAGVPQPGSGWQAVAHDWTDWKPRYIAFDQEIQAAYQADGRPVGLYLAFYGRQQQDAELVNSQNVMVVQKHPVWRQIGHGGAQVQIDGGSLEVRQARLDGNGQRLLVWHWYWLEGTHTASDIHAKLIEARNRLLGGRHPSVGIVVYTPYENDQGAAEQRLQAFLDSLLPALEAELARLD